MFWVMVWAMGFLLFLLIPLVCVPDNRRRLYFRVKLLKWNVEAEVAQAAMAAVARGGNNNSNSNPAAAAAATGAAAAAEDNDSNNFHYVLSRAQEDEIRESFLTGKLKKYTLVSLSLSLSSLHVGASSDMRCLSLFALLNDCSLLLLLSLGVDSFIHRHFCLRVFKDSGQTQWQPPLRVPASTVVVVLELN